MIVDEVLLGAEKAEYAELLAPFEVFRVGVMAPLDVLETRERLRGDRMIGLARAQYYTVHFAMTYDLTVDTRQSSPYGMCNPDQAGVRAVVLKPA